MADCTERQRRKAAQGYTYIALLILIAALGVGLAATGEVWSTAMKREKEEELLFAGSQLRNAIAQYSIHSPGGTGRYPMNLEDLLKDPHFPATRRYLRKIYPDPITNSINWGLLKGPNGEILGVHSLSEDEPLRKTNFSLADQGFEGKLKYSEWIFFIPARLIQSTVMKPAGSPAKRNR